MGTAYPLALAGLTRGAWALREPLGAAGDLPPPGVACAHASVAWSDSLAIRIGEGAAWQGYEAALAQVDAVRIPRPEPRVRSVFSLLNGDFNLQETALHVERGDSLRWLAVEALSGTRGERGALGLAGRHLWTAAGRWHRGGHGWEAEFSERGAAGRLKSGEEETASGESGRVSYDYRAGDARVAVALERGLDVHRSFLPARDSVLWSRRDAEAHRFTLEAGTRRGVQDLGLRLAWSRGRVRRDRAPVSDREASSLWAAARCTRPAGEGTLDLELGAGRHGGLTGWDVAPAAVYRFAAAPFSGRVAVERMLSPVWSDLAPGTAPFLQRTWIAGFEVGAGESQRREARASFWMGRSRDRALVHRLPLEEQWLRDGAARDAAPHDFGMMLVSAVWRGRGAGLSGEGFALARHRDAQEPQVDPARGGRAAAEWSFREFQGDLGITLRCEVEAVGPRESESVPPRRLGGYAGVGAAAVLTLGDAVVTACARNLTRQPRDLPWTDSSSGRPARDPGHVDLRLAVLWRLFN